MEHSTLSEIPMPDWNLRFAKPTPENVTVLIWFSSVLKVGIKKGIPSNFQKGHLITKGHF